MLTGVPTLLTPIVQVARGETAAWGGVIPIGTITLVLLGVLVWFLSATRPDPPER